MRRKRRERRRGPDPKPVEERRSILIGVKVSPREFGTFRAAAGGLPVATWMRGRALDALAAQSASARAEAFLAQARAFRDRADEVLEEMDRKLAERIAAVDRLLERAGESRFVSGSRPATRRVGRGGRRK